MPMDHCNKKFLVISLDTQIGQAVFYSEHSLHHDEYKSTLRLYNDYVVQIYLVQI